MGSTKIHHHIVLSNEEFQKDLVKARSGVGVKTYKSKKALFDLLKKL